jgi:hypothetical protein
MKNVNKLSLILFLAIAGILTSCSSDSSSGSGGPATGSYITAKVDGASYTTVINGVSAASASRSGSGASTLIMVLGSNLTSNSVSINLFGVTAPGTYTVNSSSDSVMSYVEASSSIAYGTGICDGSTGTITVTTLTDTKIEGTFSFSGKDGENCASAAKSITNGSFRGVFVQ